MASEFGQFEGTTLEEDKDARLWGMLCHLAALSGWIGVPLGWILGPLVIWLIKRNDYPFVDDQGKEAVNFQLSILIYTIISIVLCLVVIGIAMLVALSIFQIVVIIIAAIRANSGERYRYPLCIRFIS
jgi:uncharacterized Tic20 family protein